MNTKNSTKRQLYCRLVDFLVFNSICQIINVPSNGVNRVRRDQDRAELFQMELTDEYPIKSISVLTGCTASITLDELAQDDAASIILDALARDDVASASRKY